MTDIICESCKTTEEVMPGCGKNEDRYLCISCEMMRRLNEIRGNGDWAWVKE